MSDERQVGEVLHDQLVRIAKLCLEAGRGSYSASVILRAYVNRDGKIEVGRSHEVALLLSGAQRMEPPGGGS